MVRSFPSISRKERAPAVCKRIPTSSYTLYGTIVGDAHAIVNENKAHVTLPSIEFAAHARTTWRAVAVVEGRRRLPPGLPRAPADSTSRTPAHCRCPATMMPPLARWGRTSPHTLNHYHPRRNHAVCQTLCNGLAEEKEGQAKWRCVGVSASCGGACSLQGAQRWHFVDLLLFPLS